MAALSLIQKFAVYWTNAEMVPIRTEGIYIEKF